MKKFFQSFIFLPFIIASAIAFILYQLNTKAPIEHEKRTYPVKAVNVITAKKLPFRARAMAFGNVEPTVILKAKAEISGKISYLHPDLKKGASLKKGTVVLRIERTTFTLSLNQTKAGLVGSQSSLEQLITEEKNTKQSLLLALKNLKVGLKEFERIKTIWNKRLIARSTLDKEEQKVLSLRQQVQDIKGKLASYKSRKLATQAQINQSKTQVDQSKDTLGKTEVRLPFDARIGNVAVEKGEFTPAGTLLFEALGLEKIEIIAQLPTRQFRPLLSGLENTKKPSLNLRDPENLGRVLSKMNIEARVRLVGGLSESTVWKGQLVRLSESIDPLRDTIGLIIEVDRPYEGVIPGERPPLLKGMYTSVELFSPARARFILPRKAIHQGRVYIATADNTLSIRRVKPLFLQGNLVVLSDENSDITIGEKIIISDVIPVMEGMPLNVIPDARYEKILALKALGKPLPNDVIGETLD
jgi:multidrug efflux pump subunit AcrA (membrane-fusion protein)